MNLSSRLVSGVAPRPTRSQYRSSVRNANMPQSAKPTTDASADPTVGLHTSSIHLFPDIRVFVFALAKGDCARLPTTDAKAERTKLPADRYKVSPMIAPLTSAIRF